MIKEYTLEFIRQLLQNKYHLSGQLTKLSGYTDQNFLLKNLSEGKQGKYTVKISSSLQSQNLIVLQNYVLKKLEKYQFNFDCEFSRIVKTIDDEDMIKIQGENGSNYIRVLTFIEGQLIWQLSNPSLNLFEEAGRISGNLSKFLQNLSRQESTIVLINEQQSEKHYFNVNNFNLIYSKNYHYLDQQLKQSINIIKNQFNQILPILKNIPKQIIHNDICLTNLLVRQTQINQYHITGLIDFSSMIYTYRIIQLVILCARINLYQQNPFRNIFLIVAAYNKIRKLSQAEKSVLFPMIKTRLGFLLLLSYDLSGVDSQYFTKCRNGYILYINTFTKICSNEQFRIRLQSYLKQE